jgi:hypothetical protein
MSDGFTKPQSHSKDDTHGATCLGQAPLPSNRSSREEGGPSTGGPEEIHSRREVRGDLEEVRDNLGSRPTERIQVDPSVDLLEAFEGGKAAEVYEKAILLQKAYHALLLEVSQLRFKVNFGGPSCQNCEGLKAGPQVTATCFQVGRCEFRNYKEGDESSRVQRVLARLMT